MEPKDPCDGFGKSGRRRVTHKWSRWRKSDNGVWWCRCLNDQCYEERTRQKTPRGYEKE